MGVLRFPPIAELVTNLRDTFNIKVCVETGSYRGESTSFAAENFEQVITLDIREDYQAQCKERCAKYDNVVYHIGDSRTVLPEIVESLTAPALFWLDAHSVTGMFGPEDDCPILEELDTINRSRFKHFILIDDLHCFIPPLPHDATKWPEAWEIYQKAAEGGYFVRTAHDIAVLVPMRARPIVDTFAGAVLRQTENRAHGRVNLSLARLHRNLRMPKLEARGIAYVGPRPHEGPFPNENATSYTEIVRTVYGTMLVPRYDTNQTPALRGGYSLDHIQIQQFKEMLQQRPGAVFVDVGANVGAFGFALQPVCAKVFMFEAQRIIYNMVCGSIAINGWQNVVASNVAISDGYGNIEVPEFDYNKPLSFGSIEFGPSQRELLQQDRVAPHDNTEKVPTAPLDHYHFPRLDLLKIDVEGFELKLLQGAWTTLTTHKPIIYIEHTKVNGLVLGKRIRELDYEITDTGSDYLCFPKE